MTTVFVVSKWPSVFFLLVAALVLAALVGFVSARDQFVSHDDRGLVLWMGGLLVVAIVTFVSYWCFRQAQLRTDYLQGRASIVEGCLTGFTRSPVPGHDSDSIRVGQEKLSYDDNTPNGGYHVTEAEGGAIHADSRVRLYLVGDVIVRLDVQQHACPVAPRI